MTQPLFLYAQTDLLSPEVMRPVQQMVGELGDTFEADVASTGPVTPQIRTDFDRQVKAITDNELEGVKDLLTALHGLTFGDDASISTLGQILHATEDANIDTANSWSGHH